MPATYTTFSDVKRVLDTNIKNRIRFNTSPVKDYDIFTLSPTSNIQDMAKRTPNYATIFDPSKIVFQDSYAGDLQIALLFTSPTEYICYIMPDGDKKFRNVGAGDISNDFTPVAGDFEIMSGVCSGTIVVNDVVLIKTIVHCSVETADFYIQHAEVIIDNAIEGSGARLKLSSPRMFTFPDIPQEIKVATTYLAAYILYTSVFAEEQKDFEIKNASTFVRHFVDGWKKRADQLLSDYIAHAGRRPPMARTPDSPSEFYGIDLTWLEPNIGKSCGCDDAPKTDCGC